MSYDATMFNCWSKTRYSLFEIIDRICTEKYVPTVVDVIRTRTKTLGITDMKFDLEIGKLLRLVDVGGQRNERRKWMVSNVLIVIHEMCCCCKRLAF